MAKAFGVWMCPECGTSVPMEFKTKAKKQRDGVIPLRISVTETTMADIFAHAWTHQPS